MLRVVIFSLCILAAYGSPHKDCGSTESMVEDLQIAGCADGASICDLKKGTNVSVSIKFKTNQAPSSINGIKVVIHGIISGVPIPFPPPQEDACQKSGLTCPLQPSTENTFTLSLPVLTSYPSVRLTIKFELVDQTTSKDILCSLIPAEIVSQVSQVGARRRPNGLVKL